MMRASPVARYVRVAVVVVAVFRRHQHADVAPDDLVRRETEHPIGGAVERQDGAVGRDRCDCINRVVDHGARLRIGADTLFFEQALRGDVADGADVADDRAVFVFGRDSHRDPAQCIGPHAECFVEHPCGAFECRPRFTDACPVFVVHGFEPAAQRLARQARQRLEHRICIAQVAVESDAENTDRDEAHHRVEHALACRLPFAQLQRFAIGETDREHERHDHDGRSGREQRAVDGVDCRHCRSEHRADQCERECDDEAPIGMRRARLHDQRRNEQPGRPQAEPLVDCCADR